MKKILFYIVTALLIFGLWGAATLSYGEFSGTGGCPHLGVIPACYIVFICFLIPLITHIFGRRNSLFYLCSGFAFLLATFASVGQLSDAVQCPKTESGVPMCYISFFLFLAIISLKIIYQRRLRSQ